LERVVADIGAVPVTDEIICGGSFRSSAVCFENVLRIVTVEAVGLEGVVGCAGAEVAVIVELRLQNVRVAGVIRELASSAANAFSVAREGLRTGVCFVAVAGEREFVIGGAGVVGGETEVGDVHRFVVVVEAGGGLSCGGTVAGEVRIGNITVIGVVRELFAAARRGVAVSSKRVVVGV